MNIFSDEIIAETKNPNVVIQYIDLASFRSIREFASRILDTETSLDILIHNAGVSNYFEKFVTEDGIEQTMQAKYV
jgi:NAD(P)-dependent dehydrogenase (short-subunit alcohol dehydrogenase family)